MDLNRAAGAERTEARKRDKSIAEMQRVKSAVFVCFGVETEGRVLSGNRVGVVGRWVQPNRFDAIASAQSGHRSKSGRCEVLPVRSAGEAGHPAILRRQLRPGAAIFSGWS